MIWWVVFSKVINCVVFMLILVVSLFIVVGELVMDNGLLLIKVWVMVCSCNILVCKVFGLNNVVFVWFYWFI